MSEGATTTGDVPGVQMPFAAGPLRRDRKRTRVRKRRRAVGEEMLISEWKTRQVDGDTWEVKVGKKWVQGMWRTVNGHRVFFKGSGGMLPARSKAFTGVKPGIIAKIKRALFGEPTRKKRSEGMESIRDVAAQLMEAEGKKAAGKQVIELIALDMAEAPKVQRRLAKLLGDGAADTAPELAEVLMASLTKWLEAKGIKVQGTAAAEKALRTAAKG